MDSNKIFGKHQIMPGNFTSLRLGESNLWIKREKEGWYILPAVEPVADSEIPEFNKGEYFQTGKSNSMVIAPALPIKPLVFKGNNLFVSPKQKFTFFLKIPITLQLYYSKNQPENLLKEIPFKRLSDTWFGEPDNGESAFALGNEYFLNFDQITTSPMEAICPITILNNTANSMEVQRLILRVENLTLYQNAEKTVTSVVQLEYKGPDTISAAEYHYAKIFNGEKQEILTKPRNTSGKQLMKINFHFIKNIYKTE
jgi:hypothetical protein